jgi:hypothetical protein
MDNPQGYFENSDVQQKTRLAPGFSLSKQVNQIG